MSRATPGVMRAQVWSLAGQGLKGPEIIAKLGYARSSVYKYLADMPRSGETWTGERIARLQRIHEAALGVIAEAFGAGIDEVRTMLLGDAAPVDAPAIHPTLASPPAPAPAARRTAIPAAGAERVYRLVEMGGQFLRANGRGFTAEPNEAWSGTAAQVKDQRPGLRDAKHCKSKLIQS